MGQFFDHIPDRLIDFMRRSKMFFVATAPLENGSVNVSPKANEGSFEVVNNHRVRYLDLTGSGNETISHLLQEGNGRITLMFCNIEEGSPNIVRLYGKGTVFERATDAEFDQRWRERHDGRPVPIGGRAIIDIAVHTCSTSCGYSMPVYEFKRKRTVLDDFFTKFEGQSPEAMAKYKKKTLPDGAQLVNEQGTELVKSIDTPLEAYWALCNNLSIDGLPGLRSVRKLLDAEEQNQLLIKRQNHDQLQGPRDDLGPLQNVKGTDKSIVKVAQKQERGMDYTYNVLAFTVGCALTYAVLIAQGRV
jgi:hypothetical protein